MKLSTYSMTGNWLIVNELGLNVDNTCFMVFFHHTEKTSVNFKLLLGGLEIKKLELPLLRFNY